jgi:hypothetical protein
MNWVAAILLLPAWVLPPALSWAMEWPDNDLLGYKAFG